jgi:hypothetical protein
MRKYSTVCLIGKHKNGSLGGAGQNTVFRTKIVGSTRFEYLGNLGSFKKVG